MAYDAARRRVVLFGGDDGTNRLGDTWELDGLNWAKLTTLVIPSRNEKDVGEFPKQVTRDLEIELVDNLDQVFALAFEDWDEHVTKPEEEHTGESRPEAPLSPSAPH